MPFSTTENLPLITETLSIHWFRRDLRLDDNAALYHALKSGLPILPVFIFDTNILDELKNPDTLTEDKRVIFIHQEITRLKNELNNLGSDLLVLYGKPIEVLKSLLKKYTIQKVFTNHDYEPYATKRDNEVRLLLKESSIEFHTYKDQVVFETNEILKDDEKPYTVYTPYSKKWKMKLNDFYMKSYPTEKYFQHFSKIENPTKLISLKEMDFKEDGFISFPKRKIANEIIAHYIETRDIPGILGTSRISIHLRFGTISIRQLVKQSMIAKGEKYLNELIWREFYMMILHHFPKIVTNSFNEKYDNIKWRNNESEFDAWCDGKTGYPIVDAGMRELNTTGYMHNRVRMAVASFLTKHLLIDWRWGEAYFAKKLLDYELASNNGGWQWAAGTGVDAAPYFRIFNPYLQTIKFDKDLQYIKKWIPELNQLEYPLPIVEHGFARKRCLEVYKAALQ